MKSTSKKIEINGTTYVPMDMLSGKFDFGVKSREVFEKFGVLHFGIKEVIRPTFFRKGFLIVTVLVPEDKYVDFYTYIFHERETPKDISLWEIFKNMREMKKAIEAFTQIAQDKRPK